MSEPLQVFNFELYAFINGILEAASEGYTELVMTNQLFPEGGGMQPYSCWLSKPAVEGTPEELAQKVEELLAVAAQEPDANKKAEVIAQVNDIQATIDAASVKPTGVSKNPRYDKGLTLGKPKQ